MKFYSINKQNSDASLKQALLLGLAPDGGLFMPTHIPVLSEKQLKDMPNMSFCEIAFEVAKQFVIPEMKEEKLKEIIAQSFNFEIPIKEIEKNIYGLELFHGPTLSFKDFGARFMARMMSYFVQDMNKELTILVATSGDTGSAVADGFFNVEGIKVIILYPSGKVSPIQEKQLTTMGGNIVALEVEGSFDDCQKLAKQTFNDTELRKSLRLSSANSINIGRLIPQSFYYFYAASRRENDDPVIFSVPSGNFGNLTGGLLAKRMGLNVKKFIASCNINDVVPQYLNTGNFTPKKSQQTLSNAMDVGNPSNFARMQNLYENDVEKMRRDIWGVSSTDEETKQAIKEVYEKYKYVLDPHGAVAWLGLKKYQSKHKENNKMIFLETAHPAKFLSTVEEVIEKKIAVPERLQAYMEKEKHSVLISTDFKKLKEFLLT